MEAGIADTYYVAPETDTYLVGGGVSEFRHGFETIPSKFVVRKSLILLPPLDKTRLIFQKFGPSPEIDTYSMAILK